VKDSSRTLSTVFQIAAHPFSSLVRPLLLDSIALGAAVKPDCSCVSLKVRKGWRQLSKGERKDRLRRCRECKLGATSSCVLTGSTRGFEGCVSLGALPRPPWVRPTQCLGTKPHDDRLKLTVPANLSLIPPVAANSSFDNSIFHLGASQSDMVHQRDRRYRLHTHGPQP